jgi:hypothetical protein
MPLTAIGSLYDEVNGFGENGALARKVARAFAQSLVSIETKGGHLRRAVCTENPNADIMVMKSAEQGV